MVKKSNGASLAQYAILLGTIIVVIVPAFYYFGNEIVSILQSYTNAYGGMNEAIASNTVASSDSATTPSTDPATTPSAGPLGGTPAVPVRDCSSDSCSIDFGSFMLSGIKDNYPGFVETAGTSGGSTELALILDQIADAADNGLIDVDSALLRKLANSGHSVADMAKQVEDQLETMKDGTTTSQVGKELLFDYILSLDDTNAFNNVLTEVLNELPYGTQEEKNIRDLVSFLGDQIVIVNDVFISKVDPVLAGIGDYDTIPKELLVQMLDIKASDYTDLDSQIICKTGDGEDPGHQCK
ncbi:MAG: hypothetical protein AB1782_12890 [Cyanobacteriota bacterium]